MQGWLHLQQLEEGSDRTILFWLFIDGDSQRKMLQDIVTNHSEHAISRRLLRYIQVWNDADVLPILLALLAGPRPTDTEGIKSLLEGPRSPGHDNAHAVLGFDL